MRMTKGEMLSLLVLMAGLGVLSSFASTKTGTPDREAAVAAALKGTLEEYLSEDEMMDRDPPLGFIAMCVENELDLSVDRIAAHLSQTIIRPIPVADCTSKTVEGDFGMFVALTTYYDQNGEEAGHFKVANADCATTSDCIVDLDWRGGGDRHIMKRHGSVWKTIRSRNRWVV